MSTPDRIREFMADYNVSRDEVWQVPGGKSWAVKHSALERIAAEKRITFDLPQIIEGSTNDKVVTILVVGRMGDTEVWSFGEASPSNCKNAYVWSMAEKRAKDRCILKLLAVHGAVYSEDEIDERKHAGEPPTDIGEPHPVCYDPDTPKKSSYAIKKDTPELWGTIVGSFREAKSYAELKEVAASEFVQNATKAWDINWINDLREEFSTCAMALREMA